MEEINIHPHSDLQPISLDNEPINLDNDINLMSNNDMGDDFGLDLLINPNKNPQRIPLVNHIIIHLIRNRV